MHMSLFSSKYISISYYINLLNLGNVNLLDYLWDHFTIRIKIRPNNAIFCRFSFAHAAAATGKCWAILTSYQSLLSLFNDKSTFSQSIRLILLENAMKLYMYLMSGWICAATDSYAIFNTRYLVHYWNRTYEPRYRFLFTY